MKAKKIEVKSKRKSKKKFIFILLIVFIVFFLVGFYLNKSDEEPLTAENYVIDQDSVESITTVTQKGELTDILPSQEDGTNQIEYVYKKDEGSQEAIDQYVKYLEEEKGFVELSEDENDSEKNTETKTKTNAQESSESAESKESTDIITPLTYATQSQEENKLFEVNIKEGENNYYITVFRQEGQLPKDEEEEKSQFTRDDAKAYLKEFLDSSNALNNPFDNYTSIFDVGRSIVNDEECYGVSLYKKGPSGYNYIVAKYFVSLENRNIFKYNLQTGESIKIN